MFLSKEYKHQVNNIYNITLEEIKIIKIKDSYIPYDEDSRYWYESFYKGKVPEEIVEIFG